MLTCPGKQVEILYEPVAVRHAQNPADLTEGHSFGKCHWSKL